MPERHADVERPAGQAACPNQPLAGNGAFEKFLALPMAWWRPCLVCGDVGVRGHAQAVHIDRQGHFVKTLSRESKDRHKMDRVCVGAHVLSHWRTIAGVPTLTFGSIQFGDNLPHRVPHPLATRVLVAVWVAHDVRFRAETEASQHNLTRVGHGPLRNRHGRVDLVDRGFDQDRVMDGRADPDTTLGRQTARESKHLRAIRLHRKIAEGARIDSWAEVESPPEHCVQAVIQVGMIDRRIGPAPEAWVRHTMEVQQFSCVRASLPDPGGKPLGALCGFVLILMVFMHLHGLLGALNPGAYQTNGPPLSACSDVMLVAIFQYFSTVTLTTVGFGDIVPVTPAARLATGLEAIVGQLYLAVVIATLVGRVAARRD
jgi:hypothetical protein